MKNKIIFFSVDRLGDYLIRSNVIKKISENYNECEIVCSETNYKLISSQKFFSRTFEFNTKKKYLNKLLFLKNFFRKKYSSVIVLDGKNISNLIMLVVNADFKFTVLYKKKGLFKNFLFNITLLILKLFKIKHIVLLSKDLIDQGYKENYPNKSQLLNKYYPNINNETYFFERSKKTNLINLNNYIVIHMDEKFNDVFDIKENLDKALNKLNQTTNKKIIITSNLNEFDYFKNLSLKKINFDEISKLQDVDYKIICIKNSNLNQMIDLMENSSFNISCHSGFFVHTSMMLNKNTLDLINYNQNDWLNSWISNKNNYKRIYKSDKKTKKDVVRIFEEIAQLINES